jgi:hypothetical protein
VPMVEFGCAREFGHLGWENKNLRRGKYWGNSLLHIKLMVGSTRKSSSEIKVLLRESKITLSKESSLKVTLHPKMFFEINDHILMQPQVPC